jgi:NAD-dependent dihydropyrimidine dehydrogenase PreA subunit
VIRFIDEEKCTVCGTCVENCPMDVFRMETAGSHAVIKYPGDCQTCYQCEVECPSGAICVDPQRKENLSPCDGQALQNQDLYGVPSTGSVKQGCNG